MNHGRGSPMRTSKMLLPMDEDTAMSPSPCLATMTEESKSGTEVPAASTVNPATATGIPRELDTIVAHSTIQNEKHPIQTMESKNPSTAQRTPCRLGRRTSGRVSHSISTSGSVRQYHTLPLQLSGKSHGSIGSPASASFWCSSCFAFQNMLARYQVSKSSWLMRPDMDLSISPMSCLTSASGICTPSLASRDPSSLASMDP
mmetsp:Transcript_73724/g.169038  ORF Transcript_73724/g.169038 Transcript_73724/m.169038 type:complete len:202 (-) Transcript_73724:775-1380(-)